MKELIFSILFITSSALHAQNERLRFIGGWEESLTLTSTDCNVDVDSLKFTDWQLNIFHTGEFNRNDTYGCYGKKYPVQGEWSFDSDTLFLVRDTICTFGNDYSEYFTNIVWLTDDLWYSCLTDGKLFYIYAYRRRKIL